MQLNLSTTDKILFAIGVLNTWWLVAIITSRRKILPLVYTVGWRAFPETLH
jgi:hypothetical protein